MSAAESVKRCVCCGDPLTDARALRCTTCRQMADHLPRGYAIHRSLLDERWYAMYYGWYPRRADGSRLSFETRENAQMWCLWHGDQTRAAIRGSRGIRAVE